MLLISGHRIQKLQGYNHDWIKSVIADHIKEYHIGLSGMASGVDLWFCQALLDKNRGYFACVPFEEQSETMSSEDAKYREFLLNKAWNTLHIRNSQMVDMATEGIIVWDGNKGGTHNVFQQMLEKHKPFVWIEPNSSRVYEIG